jgi:hypothetical protein
MIPARPFKLVGFEVESVLWQKLVTHYTERLQILREKNDGSLTPEETARVRGSIHEIKQLLELGNPAPVIKTGD